MSEADPVAAGREVLHLAWDFVRPSEGWMYDLVTLTGDYSPSVLCEQRLLADQFPFDRARQELPRSTRFGSEWWSRQLRKRARLPVGPANYWHSTLQSLRPAADVFHAHFGPTGWMAVNAGLTPVVTSFYGYDATAHGTLDYWGRRYPELFALGSYFVVEGPAMGRRLEALGAPSDRIRVLPLLADLGTMTWREPTVTGPISLLMAGRFMAKKGFDHGIEAFAETCKGTDARLTVMGDGPEGQALRAAVDRLGVSDQVRFVPFGTRAEFHRMLGESDLVMQPSRIAPDGDSEGGAPVVLLDAQAIGPVVIGSRHDDIPFVLNDQGSYLFAEGDRTALVETLAQALAERGSWPERSRHARQHVEAQHGRDAVARCRDDIYAEAASPRT